MHKTLKDMDLATPVAPDVEERALKALRKLIAEVAWRSEASKQARLCGMKQGNTRSAAHHQKFRWQTLRHRQNLLLAIRVSLFGYLTTEPFPALFLYLHVAVNEVLSKCPAQLRERDAKLLRDRLAFEALSRKEQRLESEWCLTVASTSRLCRDTPASCTCDWHSFRPVVPCKVCCQCAARGS